MKHSIVFAVAVLFIGVSVLAQDAAVEERLNKLTGQVEELQAANARLQKEVAELARALGEVRERLNAANANAVSHEDIRRLAASIKEVDNKREADQALIMKAIEGLKTAPPPVKPPKSPPKETTAPQTPTEVYEHEIQQGETLSLIVQAYRAKGIKVTVDAILKANPGLNPNRLVVGRKIAIPPPKD